MSDDLVQRLRESGSRSEVELHEDREDAADSIEELESKLDDKEAECRYLRGQVGLLTAKLERAVFSH